MPSLDARIPPPVLMLAIGGAMAGLARFTPRWPADEWVAWLVAGAVAVVAAGFNVAGFRAIRRAGSTIDPTRPASASALVTEGPFAISRNPMYVGFTGLLLAWAVALRAPAMLAGPLLFAAYLTRFQIVPEEVALRARFGEAFERYAGRVRRWL